MKKNALPKVPGYEPCACRRYLLPTMGSPWILIDPSELDYDDCETHSAEDCRIENSMKGWTTVRPPSERSKR